MDHGGTGVGWISTEEWLLLAEMLCGGRPRGIAEVVAAVTPAPASECCEVHRQAEERRRADRQRRVITVFLHLCRRGLIVEAVPAGEVTSDVYRLSPAGRHAVTEAPRLWLASAGAS